MNVRRCKGCDRVWQPKRSDAVTCSPACRQRYKRMCDRITAEMLANGFCECSQCGIVREYARVTCAVCGSCKTKRLKTVPDDDSICHIDAQAEQLAVRLGQRSCSRCGFFPVSDGHDAVCIVPRADAVNGEAT